MAKNPHAVALGKLGGSVSSDAKTAAARKNGRRGGRPRCEKPVEAYVVIVDVPSGREISSREPIEIHPTSNDLVIRNLLTINGASGHARIVFRAKNHVDLSWIDIDTPVVIGDSVQPHGHYTFTDD